MPYPQQPPKREREYPPTPYAPRSEATRAYRDAYDLGLRHFRTLSWDMVRRHEAGLRAGSPEKRGYRDGVIAAWSRWEKSKIVDPDIARDERAERAEQLRRESQKERPY